MTIHLLKMSCKIPQKYLGLVLLLNLVGLYSRRNYVTFRYSHFPNYFYPQKHNSYYKFPKIEYCR
jgi:hypothetical protein